MADFIALNSFISDKTDEQALTELNVLFDMKTNILMSDVKVLLVQYGQYARITKASNQNLSDDIASVVEASLNAFNTGEVFYSKYLALIVALTQVNLEDGMSILSQEAFNAIDSMVNVKMKKMSEFGFSTMTTAYLSYARSLENG